MKKRLILTALCVAWSGIASAAIYFSNTSGDNDFSSTVNWAITANSDCAVNVVGANRAVVKATESRPRFLWVGNAATKTGEVEINSSGDLTVGQLFYAGYSGGAGTLNVNGGKLTTTLYDVVAANGAGSTGTINLYNNGTITAQRFFLIGNGGVGYMAMSNGIVNVNTYDFSIGSGATGSGTFDMYGGLITVKRDLVVGDVGSGTMNMYGGTVNATNGLIYIAQDTGSSGQLNLSGGTINASALSLFWHGASATNMLNITGTGQIILTGNKAAAVQTYIDNGYINGKVVYDSVNNKTVLDSIIPPVNVGLYLLR